MPCLDGIAFVSTDFELLAARFPLRTRYTDDRYAVEPGVLAVLCGCAPLLDR